jgi:hypothetical protein
MNLFPPQTKIRVQVWRIISIFFRNLNCKMCFFFPFLFILTPANSWVHNFLNFWIERFKLCWNGHLKLYKSSCNSKGNREIFKDFLRVLEIGYELFLWIFFGKNDSPLLGGIVTFLPLICLCQFLVRQMHQEKGFIYSLETINNGPSSKDD